MLDQRGQLLRSALGFAGCSLPSYDRALWALRTWLDSWPGIGHVAVGMHRQGYDLRLTQYDERCGRATFYTTGTEHSPTSATGTAWEPTPWRATQRTAWEALKNGGRRLRGTDGAEGLPVLVAVGAGAEAAGDLALAQVSGDSPGWLTIHLAETVKAVTAASRHAVQKHAEQIVHCRR
jgi:hypothetical protein